MAKARKFGQLEILLALKSTPLLEDLDPEALAVLAAHMRVLRVRAGGDVPRKHTRRRAVVLVARGELEIRHPSGRTVRTGPNEIATLEKAAPGLQARATRDAIALMAEADLLEDLIEGSFDVLVTIIEKLATGHLALRRRLGPTAGFDPDPAPIATPAWTRGDDLGERIELLRANPVLRDLGVGVLAGVAFASREVIAEPGEVLWDAGDAADEMWMLASGRVQCVSDDGAQHFAFVEGALLGVLDALAGVPRWHRAQTETPIRALSFQRADLLDLLEASPEVAVDLARILGGPLAPDTSENARQAVAGT